MSDVFLLAASQMARIQPHFPLSRGKLSIETGG
jgi:hypothetical protein